MSDDLLQILKRLIAVRSETGRQSEEVIDVIADELRRAGHSPDKRSFRRGKKTYFTLSAERGEGDRRTTLIGHLDVVPGTEEQYRPRTRGVWLYGRGAADAKGPAVAGFKAFTDADEGRLDGRLRLILTTDEEIGGREGARPLLVDQGAHDFTIALEPFAEEVIYKHNGVLRFFFTVRNEESHTKSDGANAIWTYAAFIRGAKEYVASLGIDPELGRSLFNPVWIRKVGSTRALGIHPGLLRAAADVRIIPSVGIDELYAGLERLAIEQGIDGVHLIVDGPPLDTDPCNPWVQRLLVYARGLNVSRGSTDAKWANGPAVVYGPRGEGIHGPDERVNIPSLLRVYHSLRAFVEKK